MIDRARIRSPIVPLLAWLICSGCNSVLGIEEPIESPRTVGDNGTTTQGGGGSTTGGGAKPAPPKDGGGGAAAPMSLEWAQWPMPNPASAGLPNAQSYDTTSFVGVVLDLITGLQWQQTVDESSYTWHEASTFCDGLTVSGGGWRLPTRIELLSLVDYTNPNPVIDPNAFPETPSANFWTASPLAGDATKAWNVNFEFSDGMADRSEITMAHRVRCVR